MRVVIDEVLKWRFTNPEEFAARTLQIHADPAHEAIEDRETVDGRAIEYSSSPVRDASGAIVGRVEMLHDVTPARLALADARRLATERAQLLEREERRSHEEMALTRAAHAMASALTPREIHEILLDNTHALVGACHKSAVLASDARRDAAADAPTRGFAEETIRHMTYRRRRGARGRAWSPTSARSSAATRSWTSACRGGSWGRRGSARSCTSRSSWATGCTGW